MGHRIQNFEVLAGSGVRRGALAIAEAGYTAVNTGEALKRSLHLQGDTLHIGDSAYPLARRRVFFVGIGKCALDAAEAIETLLGDRLTSGIALDVAYREPRHLKKIETYIGTHPLPSDVNVQAAKRIMEFLAGRAEDDLIIMLISGGGSTLLCLHEAPMTCLDESMLFGELTAKGATIRDINTVRKHISSARGGALAKAAYPAEVISLIVSDVPGNDIGFIASGPTVLDVSTVDDARAVLEGYDISASNTVAFLETPKEQKYFERVTNVLFLTNQDALSAMQSEAEKLGYATTIVDDHFSGEAREIGRAIVEKLHDAPAKTAFLYAGESTVTLDAGGPSPRRSGLRPREGGRNQEMALAALEHIRADELILPFASDGHDNSDHAGAIGDDVTLAHAKALGLSIEEHLDEHRSYDFFTTTGDALQTGYTGSNVSDLIIALKK
ncbi:MAG: DUF4147 domain-containing protein [bacterium]|nr:DUF4147 domain-containing protein [bacterium]